MNQFRNVRHFLFRLRYRFKGVPVSVGGRALRLDESLRRFRIDDDAALQNAFCEILRPGDAVVDVGANFGLYTLLAADLVGADGQVLAFEPIPRTVQLLQHNVRINDFGERVRVIPKVVSNSAETHLTMRAEPESSEPDATASLCAEKSGPNTLKVENTRLDNIEVPKADRLRLIKVDVEGAELDVLQGGEALIRRHRPQLAVEVHGSGLRSFGHGVEELHAYLKHLGYEEKKLAGPAFHADYYQVIFTPRTN